MMSRKRSMGVTIFSILCVLVGLLFLLPMPFFPSLPYYWSRGFPAEAICTVFSYNDIYLGDCC